MFHAVLKFLLLLKCHKNAKRLFDNFDNYEKEVFSYVIHYLLISHVSQKVIKSAYSSHNSFQIACVVQTSNPQVSYQSSVSQSSVYTDYF